MFANLIAAVALLLMMYLFMQDFLNAISPGLFRRLMRLLKKTVAISLRLSLLPFITLGKAWRNFRNPPFKKIHRYGLYHLHGGRGRG